MREEQAFAKRRLLERNDRIHRDTGKPAAQFLVGIGKGQRHQRRARGNHVVAEALGQIIAEAGRAHLGGSKARLSPQQAMPPATALGR